ncbi:hypothetical protein [Effusibacillus dendaii]|uniref:Uncharacterized protein n=1 Tax=Effusibacillus dendaii TaxID=2743772 RepID=A0A7I8D8Z9_9BACL|nr:hypothetical protein [Effusibacillus dendaii]BCJ86477.1 hypothetical protein skT53_14620 [Effusibacillus dendaii]
MIRLIQAFADLGYGRKEQEQAIAEALNESKHISKLSQQEIKRVLKHIGIDEEYDDLLKRLVTGAEYLEREDLTPQQREKAQKRYDELDMRFRNLRGWV